MSLLFFCHNPDFYKITTKNFACYIYHSATAAFTKYLSLYRSCEAARTKGFGVAM